MRVIHASPKRPARLFRPIPIDIRTCPLIVLQWMDSEMPMLRERDKVQPDHLGLNTAMDCLAGM